MSSVDYDLVVIFLLILVNGLFAMAEIAIISCRKARLTSLAEEGNKRARQALDLANSPNLFLSTVQIGITFVSVMTGVFGGVTVAHRFALHLTASGFFGSYGETIALAIVVLSMTYVSLIIGELVPKRLALNNPERFALLAAGPMRWLSVVAAPLISFLSVSTDQMLKLLRVRPSGEPPFTEDEIRTMIAEATTAGVFEEEEQELVERVFRLGDRSVGVLMTPRQKIVWLDINKPLEKLKKEIARSTFSRFPVCQGTLGNVLGILHVRDLLARTVTGQTVDLKSCLEKPLFVVESMHALKVMELFRESGSQIALVIDEYGTIEGLVTLDDVLEAIIGDIPSENEARESKVIRRDDGSWLMDGMLPLDELKTYLDIKRLPAERTGNFQTLGGFIMNYLKRIPSSGDHFISCGWRFEVVDMDRRRVDKVLIQDAREDKPAQAD